MYGIVQIILININEKLYRNTQTSHGHQEIWGLRTRGVNLTQKWGPIPFPSLPIPSPPFPSLPSPPLTLLLPLPVVLPSPPIPFPSPLPNAATGSGERCKLPQRGPGWSPGRNRRDRATLQGIRILSGILKNVSAIFFLFLFLMQFNLWRAAAFVSSPINLL